MKGKLLSLLIITVICANCKRNSSDKSLDCSKLDFESKGVVFKEEYSHLKGVFHELQKNIFGMNTEFELGIYLTEKKFISYLFYSEYNTIKYEFHRAHEGNYWIATFFSQDDELRSSSSRVVIILSEFTNECIAYFYESIENREYLNQIAFSSKNNNFVIIHGEYQEYLSFDKYWTNYNELILKEVGWEIEKNKVFGSP